MARPALLWAIVALALGACASQTAARKHEVGCISGTLTGAVVGGLLGSTIGRGGGNAAATVVGTGVGAVAGNQLACEVP
jgi:uncharacterized protein YcfJ